MRKKLITMGLVSALGASTSVMAIDLDPAAKDKADVLAIDTIDTTNVVGASTVPLITVGAGHELVQTTSIGVGIAADDQNFLRVTLSGATFAAAATATVANATVSTVDGGAAGDDYVVLGVQAGAGGVLQTDNFDLTNTTYGADGSSDVGVTITQYATQAGAINQSASDQLYTISGTGYTWGNTVQLDASDTTATNQTAEVSTGFKQYVSGATTTVGPVTVGDIQMEVSGAINVQTGAAAVAADAANLATSKITYVGDFSAGDWTFGADGNCAAASPIASNAPTVATDKGSATVSNITAVVGNGLALCNTVDGITDVINTSGYDFTVDLSGLTGQVAPTDLSGSLGSVFRNGTTVQIPYLTTFEDYNQRLVIVNRGTSDAAYVITFTHEEGVTATPKDGAEGTVDAGEVLSINAKDIVDLTGKTRTAATLVVVAPSGNIDVATNQVNLDDASTDTVVLQ